MSEVQDNRTITLYRAGAVRDAGSHPSGSEAIDARPGAVAVCNGAIVASGAIHDVEKAIKDLGPIRVVELPNRLLLPALVNAHAHLDLTDIGPVPYGGDFIKWIEMVIARRPREPEAIRAAVLNGLRISRAAGVGMIGDIAGSDEAARTRVYAEANLSIGGVSYLECFGIGAGAPAMAAKAMERQDAIRNEMARNEIIDLLQRPRRSLRERLAQMRARSLEPVRSIWLQPHAPYSAGLAVYEAAVEGGMGLPSTHLAETHEEDEFVRHASGPFAELLRRLGKWDDSIQPTGQSPVEYLAKPLGLGRWLVTHCNYVSDDDIAILNKTSTSVAYCPIASEYFGHTNHRYRDMLAAGVNVCLGTDSILCQPVDEPHPLGILPAMRRLYRRDGCDPSVLLGMATWRGTNGLNFYLLEAMSVLRTGAPARLLAVKFDPDDATDALKQVLLNNAPAEPIFG